MKKIFAILFTVVLLGLSIMATCGGTTGGNLLFFDNNSGLKFLAISPVSPTGKVSELPLDTETTWSRRTTSPDGETLVFGKANYGPLGDMEGYSLVIYNAKDLYSPVTLEIPVDILHRLDTARVEFLPVWIRGEMFIKVMWGEYDFALYSVDIGHKTFELVKAVSILNLYKQVGGPASIENVLPDLSKAIMYLGRGAGHESFVLYDVETQKLTTFDAIGFPSGFLSWSPDGKHLAYMTWMGDNQVCLIRVSINGTDIQSQTVFCPELSVLPGEKMDNFTSGIDWSPDGKHLALTVWGFFSSGADSLQHLYKHLYVVNPVSSETVSYSSDVAFGSTWSPDSGKLAFLTCSSGEGPKIYTVDADGTNQNLIYTSPEFGTSTPFGPIDTNIAGWLK
jgi:Tol biopolymer transport system component